MKGEEDACFCPFCLNLTSFPTFLTLQDKHNIRTLVVKYKINLYSLRNRPEKLVVGSLFCLFLKLVQINFIFTDNVRILYIYLRFITETKQPIYTYIYGSLQKQSSPSIHISTVHYRNEATHLYIYRGFKVGRYPVLLPA
jgi:hypothetical protein